MLPGEDGFCMRQQSRPGECLVRGGNSCTIWHLLRMRESGGLFTREKEVDKYTGMRVVSRSSVSKEIENNPATVISQAIIVWFVRLSC